VAAIRKKTPQEKFYVYIDSNAAIPFGVAAFLVSKKDIDFIVNTISLSLVPPTRAFGSCPSAAEHIEAGHPGCRSPPENLRSQLTKKHNDIDWRLT